MDYFCGRWSIESPIKTGVLRNIAKLQYLNFEKYFLIRFSFFLTSSKTLKKIKKWEHQKQNTIQKKQFR
jgi:hypothetical protein